MNSRRRAELQRKLSMGPVPRPPDDLLDRIKADIPKHLQPEASPARFNASSSFTMRIAASLILLVTTAVVTFRIVQPDAPKRITSAVRAERPVHAIMKSRPQSAADASAAGTVATEEVHLEISEAAAEPQRTLLATGSATPAPPVATAPTEASASLARATSERDAAASAVTAENPVQPQGGVSMAEAAPAMRLESREGARSLPPAPPAPAAPPPPPSYVADAMQETTVVASAPLVSEAYAQSIDLAQKKTAFGISVDPEVFTKIQSDLEKKSRPAAARVNVDALVNYFAGPPARTPRRPVQLEVEASPSPAAGTRNRAMLRFSVDTARVKVEQRASTPPAAIEAKLEIDLNDDVVVSHRRIGSDGELSAEPMLLHNLSVTGLYDLELKPNVTRGQRIATIRLRYRDITTGREQTITRTLYARDLVRDWSRASRRHRLASLGAVWGESLKSSAFDAELARQAEELAAQNPGDRRARELANATSATGGT